MKLFTLIAHILLPLALLGGQTGQTPATPTTPPPGAEASYKLEAGDAIDIRFFYNPELNEQVQIRPDGRISLPFAGEIVAAGMSIADLTAKLQSVFGPILKRTAVTVQVRTFANRKIFVGGDVSRPGLLQLVGRQTVLGAIAESGGLRPTAKHGAVMVIRRGEDGKPVSFLVSLKASGNQPAEAAAFELQPLDVVLASETGITRANRFVDQYIRSMIPALLTGGFTYLVNGGIIR